MDAHALGSFAPSVGPEILYNERNGKVILQIYYRKAKVGLSAKTGILRGELEILEIFNKTKM